MFTRRFFVLALALIVLGFTVGCKDQPLGLEPEPLLEGCTLPVVPVITAVYPDTILGYGLRVDWTNVDPTYFYRVKIEYAPGCAVTGWTERGGESSMLMGTLEGEACGFLRRVIVVGYLDPKCWGEDECGCETVAAVKELP